MANRGYDVVVDVDAEVTKLAASSAFNKLTTDRETWAIPTCKRI